MTSGKLIEMFQIVKSRKGKIANIFQGLANSPSAFQIYLTLEKLISEGSLNPVEQEIVRLVVSQYNGCKYSIAFHTETARQKGLNEDQIQDIRAGHSENPRYFELIIFTRQILESRGYVRDEDIEEFRREGYTDEHIVDIVTIIGEQMFINYFNHINLTDLDLPKVPEM